MCSRVSSGSTLDRGRRLYRQGSEPTSEVSSRSYRSMVHPNDTALVSRTWGDDRVPPPHSQPTLVAHHLTYELARAPTASTAQPSWHNGSAMSRRSHHVSGNSTSSRQSSRRFSASSHRSSTSSLSPSDSVSNISSCRSSGYGVTRDRDDPQRLYDYVAKHLRYGEHDGAVWNQGTDSYVTVVRPSA